MLFFSGWFIVLILYSDFFCNVCFLRKEIKMYLDFKEKSWPYPICFALMDGPAITLYCPSIPISPLSLLTLPQAHQA